MLSMITQHSAKSTNKESKIRTLWRVCLLRSVAESMV